MKTLSIIIPVYNEAKTIAIVLDKLIALRITGDLHKEIVIIDDASADGTAEAIAPYLQQEFHGCTFQFHRHLQNSGKGAALQAGFSLCTGDVAVIQDADLEYDPSDINRLVQPVLDGYADVVYGSRFISQSPHRVLYYWHRFGNKLLTELSNMFSNINLTDMETGYKLFRSDVVKKLQLREKKFGIEPEMTAKISKIKNIRIYEVGISYFGRTYVEGKKIGWKDGLRALYCIFRYNIFN